MARPMTRRTPRLEDLEARTFLSADVTDLQQLTIELINEARTDPPAAAARVEENMSRWAEKAIAKDGDTVEEVLAEIAAAPPRPALAVDLSLMEAAGSHSEHMIAIGQQTHTGPAGLESPADRAIAAGYEASEEIAENIIYGVGSPEQAMRAFLADYGATNADDPHRENIQQTDPSEESFQDVGVAILPVEPAGDGSSAGVDPQYVVTQVFGRKAEPESEPTLLGVVYDDGDEDKFYDVGEGVGGAKVTITDKASGDATEVTTWSSGGYQAKVQPGEYQVDVHLGDRKLATGKATVGQENAKLDFRVDLEAKSSLQTASTAAKPSAPTKAETAPAQSLAARPTKAEVKPKVEAKPTKVEAPATKAQPPAARPDPVPVVTTPPTSSKPDAPPALVAKLSPTTTAARTPTRATLPSAVPARPQPAGATTPLPATSPAVVPPPATTPKYHATEPSRPTPPAPPITRIDPTSTSSTPSLVSNPGPDAEGRPEGSEEPKQVQPAPKVTKRIESLLRSVGSNDEESTLSWGRSGLDARLIRRVHLE